MSKLETYNREKSNDAAAFEGMGPRLEEAALLHWLANNLERDLNDAREWFDATHGATAQMAEEDAVSIRVVE